MRPGAPSPRHRSDCRISSGPEFTPDGKRIIGVFYPPNARESEIGGIGTVAPEGGPVHFIRRGPFANGVGHFFGPTVSPDGRFIAFTTAGRSGVSVTVMNRDGSGAHRLRESILSGWSIHNPSFSPSGRSLTFVGEHYGMGNVIIGRTPSAVLTIRDDGKRLRIVQTEKAHFFSRNPAWVRWRRASGADGRASPYLDRRATLRADHARAVLGHGDVSGTWSSTFRLRPYGRICGFCSPDGPVPESKTAAMA